MSGLLRLWRFPGLKFVIRRLSTIPATSVSLIDALAAELDSSTHKSTTDDIINSDITKNIRSMVSVKDLFNARVHLGHKTGVWNPLMLQYVKEVRAGIHVIDLNKTLEHLRLALKVVGLIAQKNGIIMFVNGRSQFDRLVQATARDCGEYFVSPRWQPGTLTNSYMLLGTLRLPDLIVFLNVPPNKTAIVEAAMSNIPSVGIVDSDCNPNLITYPIPGNDDTPSAIELYCKLFSSVIIHAKNQ